MYSKQKSLNFGQYVPNDKVLNKKIPENPKYKHVKPAVDTGKNVRRHIDELREKQKNCVHKKDEVFKRIKFSAFINLAIVAATIDHNVSQATDDGASVGNGDCNKTTKKQVERSRLTNVLMGIGELDALNEKRKSPAYPSKSELSSPYLLLDVRDKDNYSHCHIKTARHYPAAMISRSLGYETEDLKTFKNAYLSIIVLYDDDEVIASRVATTLVERGYDNIYLLSGGLKCALETCPYGLTCSSPLHMHNSEQNKNVSKEHFTHDDIIMIQQQIEDYSRRCNDPVFSSRSYAACSEKDKPSSSYKKSNASDFCSKQGSISARRDSASSSKSMEQIQIRPNNRSASDSRFKGAKKAPWK